MEEIDVSEAVVVVRLNCGEPVSVSVSDENLQNIPVVFIESSTLIEEYDNPHMLSDDDIVVRTGQTQYEDLDETIADLEDADLL